MGFFYPLLPSVFPPRVTPSSELILFLYLSYLHAPWQKLLNLDHLISLKQNQQETNTSLFAAPAGFGTRKSRVLGGCSATGAASASSTPLPLPCACALKFTASTFPYFHVYVHDVPKDNECSFKF